MRRLTIVLATITAILSWLPASATADESTAAREEAAATMLRQAQSLQYQRKFQEAEQECRQLCEKYPDTRMYRVARYSLGVALQRQGKHDAAIAELLKLFLDQPNDQAPGAKPSFYDYRHEAARQLSVCYESKNEVAQAIDWALQARDNFPFQSWCGTCNANEATSLGGRLVRLMKKAGKKDDALLLAEGQMFSEHLLAAPPAHIPVFIAEEYFARGEAQKLRQRLAGDPGRKLDLQSTPSDWILHALTILDLAERRRLEELWTKLRESKASALHSLILSNELGYHEAAAGLAATKLLADPNAVPLLRRKLRASYPTDRAWAAVLLVKLGEMKDIDVIKEMALAVPPRWHNDETHDEESRCWTDFCYALLILDPDSERRFEKEFLGQPIGYALRDASEFLKLAATDSAD